MLEISTTTARVGSATPGESDTGAGQNSGISQNLIISIVTQILQHMSIVIFMKKDFAVVPMPDKKFKILCLGG